MGRLELYSVKIYAKHRDSARVTNCSRMSDPRLEGLVTSTSIAQLGPYTCKLYSGNNF